jgi:WD40 repeat protein
VRLWDPTSGEQIGDPLEGHGGVVWWVAFSPDGGLLASAGFDGTVRLWDPTSGQQISDPLERHALDVRDVAFSPDGGLLASAGQEGTVRLSDSVWEPDRGCELAAPYVRSAQIERYLPDGIEVRACTHID